ncbi:MAG: long-chain-fatty-acid--CoA ligase [Bacillota bacterium]
MSYPKPWLKHYPEGVRPSGIEYPKIPLFALLDQAAEKYPDRPATYFYGRRLTYRQLAGSANRFANALRLLGVGRGDRVMLMMPNCPQFVIAFYGILKSGATVIQTNPLYVEREIEYQANDSRARVIVTVDMLLPRVLNARPNTGLQHVIATRLKGEPPIGHELISFEMAMQAASDADPKVEVDPMEDVAVFQYTGGTTGPSKGAMLTHHNLVTNVVQLNEWLNPLEAPADGERILTILPLFHSYGMTVCMNMGIYRGAELILLPKFELPEVMETIKATRPTSFPGVPTMYVAVNSFPNAEAYGVGSIQVCNSGGAAMPVEVMKTFESRFGASISEGYGLSEASPVTHSNPVAGLKKPGSIGIPFPDTTCRVVDLETGTRDVAPGEMGEIIIRGPQIMKGYWNKPEETANALRVLDGETWLYTGDIGTMDEDGYFYITDRKKDMILAGGYNIYPREIEEVLFQHPAVLEAVAAGVPDPYLGETVKAYIVVKPGQSVTEAELDRFCRQQLAAYKVPRRYEFRDALPKSAVGKVLRRILVEEERAKLSAAQAEQ